MLEKLNRLWKEYLEENKFMLLFNDKKITKILYEMEIVKFDSYYVSGKTKSYTVRILGVTLKKAFDVQLFTFEDEVLRQADIYQYTKSEDNEMYIFFKQWFEKLQKNAFE